LFFIYFCLLGFWCFHLFHLFHGLAFPYQAKLWMDSRTIRTRFHITEVVIVFVCGIVPPIITIIVSDYQDDGLQCLPKSTSITFYGEVVPCSIAFTIGLLLLFSSLWILRKVSLTFCKCTIPLSNVRIHSSLKDLCSYMFQEHIVCNYVTIVVLHISSQKNCYNTTLYTHVGT